MDLTKAMELFEEIEKRFKKHKSNLSEFRTRILLIDPVLRLLGWDVENPDLVELEYQPAESNRKSADYVLKNNKKNVAIVEAKNIDKKIDAVKYREQTDGYARYAEVKFFVLTNGIRWLLYERDLMTSLESLKPIVSFDVVHDEPYQCALAAISIWRPNLASDDGPSEATEPVFVALEPASEQAISEPNEQQEQQPPNDSPQDFEECYTLTSERRYPRHTTPTRLEIGDSVKEEVNNWKDVIHEIATWLVDEGNLSAQHCPIVIGRKVKRTFIDREGKVNPDGKPFQDPRPLANGLILQRSPTDTWEQWDKLKKLLEQFGVDSSTIQVFYKSTEKANG
jgi:hypothetical protein